MTFEKIIIKNFRNFKEISISLTNKNIFFGLNDVGKTNFMYALRFILDKEVRKQNFIASDYHCMNVNKEIEMILQIDISDLKNEDSQKLRAKMNGALLSEDKKVYIKLIGKYNKEETIGIPILFWGGNLEKLQEMKQKSFYYDLDSVINLVYIDSYVDLYGFFKKNINKLIKNNNENDEVIRRKIEKSSKSINDSISLLSGVEKFQNKINPEYKKFCIRNENVSIIIKSERSIKGLFSDMIPYIKLDGDEKLYPTSGEGRKKLLAYSIYDLLANEVSEKRINIFLIEEPENHLHKSMQIALSKILFDHERYKYMFISTHSPYILHEMDNVNLIRIYNDNKVNTASSLYEVTEEYNKVKRILNKNLAEAIFSDKVLLVEGDSEIVLFDKILSMKNAFYEAKGIYILSVKGIGFTKYYQILKKLKINCIVKTDNDLQQKSNDGKYSVMSFFRCNKLVGKKILPVDRIQENSIISKRNLYDENKIELDKIRVKNKIFLSKVDLENDLAEALNNRLSECLLNRSNSNEEAIKFLQNAKRNNMVKLIEKLEDKDYEQIYNHYNFECLKEMIE
ncbi:ATP-dependent nuclease [Sebaldella termitidis]|uniref:ATP-dependent nuclease n=1 Tax=Sebaldella termitidis TaxID=826 RepID=UPI003EBCFEAD